MATDQLVITIVAGARLERVVTALGTAKVVRAMPNTPGQIGQGITVWTRTPAVGDGEAAKVRAILSALGEEEPQALIPISEPTRRS